MNTELINVLPADIEKKSFEIIESELPHPLEPALAPIIKRVIHTTADFDYADALYFSGNILSRAKEALKAGACIVTDTNMAKAGINRAALSRFGGSVSCFMADADVADAAKRLNTTRAAAAMDKAALIKAPVIYVIGNAPTALIRLLELYKSGKIQPSFVVGVPVGFVNAAQSKALLIHSGIPCIAARGRKGGSNVAAAVVNALMYMLIDEL